MNIYATLAVRLSHSNLFSKKELWKNAMTYTAKFGGTCGIYLSKNGEGRGELILFFDKQTSKETRFHFEAYVQAHLQRWALPESIRRVRIFACTKCGEAFTDSQVMHRRALGFDKIRCNVCDTEVSLLEEIEQLTTARLSRVSEMDQSADTQRKRDVAISVLQGKRVTSDFDVFLCYSREDKTAVKKIGEQLKIEGILPWLDEWELRPGLPWQRVLEQQIEQIKSAAVFVGRKGIGPWQVQELEALLRQFVRRRCPVIPVLLAGSSKKPKVPLFLEGMTWVDFRRRYPDPMDQLIWGITGNRVRS